MNTMYSAKLLMVLMCWTVAASAGANIDAAAVHAHMLFLASDALNGRGSGTRDEWITATYIAAQLDRLGLKPLGDNGGFVQDVEMQRTEVMGKPDVHLGSLDFQHGDEVLLLKLPNGNAAGPLYRYVRGKAVPDGAAVLLPADAEADVLHQLKAAAIILRPETDDFHSHWETLAKRPIVVGATRIVSPGAAGTTATGAAGPAVLMLSERAYSAAVATRDGAAVSIQATTHEVTAHTWNAVGELPGHDARWQDQVLLLTAHLDHLGAVDSGIDKIYNGADDDASGSIAVLTLADALAHGAPLKRSVVFAWFGSEEAGGYGARYFVDKPVIPLASIVANLEFEMIGRPDPLVPGHTLWLTGWDRTTLGPELARHGARLVADPHPAQNFFERSDNITLARRGVVAQTVSSFGLHTDYHQPSDDIGHIDFRHMTESIQSLLAPIRWLADGNFRPEWSSNGRPQ